jgi:phosphatidylglycerophosphate synthase
VNIRAFERPAPGVGAASPERRTSSLLPQTVVDSALRAVDRVARVLVGLGVTANAVTLGCLVLAAAAGLSLAAGWFASAAVAAIVSGLGDAVDGAIARRTRGASVGGALLDASADRYGEFLLLGGLAIHFRDHVAALGLTLAAMAGSFMVSYGSAKAEALRVPVPAGIMRRAERAICLCAGITAAAAFEWLVRRGNLPSWTARAPLFAALGVLAVIANVSAVARLRLLARRRH